VNPAVFLDRDGVLNDTVVTDGVPHPPATLEELRLLPGVKESCDRLRQAGYLLIVVTNQPDVARGTQTRERVEAINERVREALAVDAVLTCFHDNADGCACRKPKPGLLEQAMHQWHIAPERSYLVGDRWSDVAAGQAAGVRSILIERSYSRPEKCRADWVAPDLPGAAELILTTGKEHP
jgi:D-glycero-D-manno-heptose 1,7-bisphosphate phosphatase